MAGSQGPAKRRRKLLRTRRTQVRRPYRSRNRNAMVSVPRSRLNFPQSQRTTLRYCTNINMDPDGTNVQHFRFNANGLFNPDATGGGGHQPRGFQEMMGIYKAYTVLGCSISINYFYEGYSGPSIHTAGTGMTQTTGADVLTPAAIPVICGVHKTLEQITGGAVALQCEQDRTSWVVMLPNGPSKTQHIRLRVSDFFGKQKLVGSPGFSGDVTSNPDEEVFFEVFCGRASDGNQGATNVQAMCTLQYDVVFTEPKTLPQSSA